MTAAGLTRWREDARRDRLARAQIDRDREAARADARITELQARAQVRREDRQARTQSRDHARTARAARRAARAAWVTSHVVDLLFVPVIAVPAVLSWTAMAAYGRLLYGPAGLMLPAFSEGAMWAFAAATTITRHRHPGRPVWHLLAGTVMFAAEGAGLNFAHGMTTTSGLHGPVAGTVYAAVSVAGVTVHQIVTARPASPGAPGSETAAASSTRRGHPAPRTAARTRTRREAQRETSAEDAREPGPESPAETGRQPETETAPDGRKPAAGNSADRAGNGLDAEPAGKAETAGAGIPGGASRTASRSPAGTASGHRGTGLPDKERAAERARELLPQVATVIAAFEDREKRWMQVRELREEMRATGEAGVRTMVAAAILTLYRRSQAGEPEAGAS